MSEGREFSELEKARMRKLFDDTCQKIGAGREAQLKAALASNSELLAAAKMAERLIRNGGIVPIKGETWKALMDAIAKAEAMK